MGAKVEKEFRGVFTIFLANAGEAVADTYLAELVRLNGPEGRCRLLAVEEREPYEGQDFKLTLALSYRAKGANANGMARRLVRVGTAIGADGMLYGATLKRDYGFHPPPTAVAGVQAFTRVAAVWEAVRRPKIDCWVPDICYLLAARA